MDSLSSHGQLNTGFVKVSQSAPFMCQESYSVSVSAHVRERTREAGETSDIYTAPWNTSVNSLII